MEALSQQPLNPWKHIFLHPKETFEWVLENNPEQFYRKLFWVYYVSTVISVILSSFSQFGISKTYDILAITLIVISPIVSFLSVYYAIYIDGFVINSIASEFFHQKRPFKLAKEVLLWSACILNTISIGRYGLEAINHTFIAPQLHLINYTFDALMLFYGLYVYANTFRALYNLSKTKSYLFAGVGTVLGLLGILLQIILKV